MAKIRKIYDQTIKPDGSKVTIYPITSTRAVYTPESITMEALINEGYRFGGVIEHLEDSPEFTDQRVFYLADKVGVYPNFGNLTLAGGELGVFCYNKSQWIKGILKGGGTNLTGYQVVTSVSLLPDEESTIGYIIGTDLYVWVGEGGDTKEGKYKNVGPFVGPQGNGIEQVFLSPTNYKLTIDFTDGTSWTSEQSIRGIAGAKGDKGDPGLTGATGATGPKGNKGDKGDSGVSLGDVVLTTSLSETETGKALDASAMQTIPHYVSAESEIEDVPSNYYTKTQVDQKLLNNKAEVNQYLTNQDNDIARLEDRIDNMMDGVDEFIHHRPTVVNNGTIINAPDDEDLVATEENTLKFADRPAINAMGYVILRKNKTFAEQVTKTNTIYEIRYDFDLDGNSVTLPDGVVLKFNGGCLDSGTLVGSDTTIEATKVKIFEGIILDGTWKPQNIYATWFGIASGENNKAHNDTIFTTYLVPSLNNINLPFVLDESLEVYFSQPITFSGNYNVRLEGSLIYSGASNTTAVTIGTASTRVRSKSFYVNILRSSVCHRSAGGTIPNHIGLKLINFKECRCDINQIANFAYNLMFYAHDTAFASNTFNIVSLTGYYAVAHYLYSDGDGWVNENLINSGLITPWNDNPYKTDGTCTGICIEAAGTYSANSNNWVKPDIEGNKIGISLKGANQNLLLSARLEDLNQVLQADNSSYCNTVIATSITNTVSNSDSSGRNNLVVTMNEVASMSLPAEEDGIRFVKVYNDNVACTNREIMNGSGNMISLVSSGAFIGSFYDITKADNYFSLSHNSAGRWRIFVLDTNYIPIELTQEVGYYITGGGWLINNDGYLVTSSGVTVTGVKINYEHVKKVFIGTQYNESLTVQRIRAMGAEKIVRFQRLSCSQAVLNYPIDGTNFATLAYNNAFRNCTLELRADINLGDRSISFPNSFRLNLNGGKFTNGTITLNRAIISPDLSSLEDATITLSGDPGKGTKHFDGYKWRFNDGSHWYNQDGINVDGVTYVKGATTTRTGMSLTSANAGLLFYDTTLKKYCLWNGEAWTNLDGTALA